MRIASDRSQQVWIADKQNLWQRCLPPSLRLIMSQGLEHIVVERERIARALRADARSLPMVEVRLALLKRGQSEVFALTPMPLKTATGTAKSYGVLMSAACCLMGTDLLRRVLEHEFAHCFDALRRFNEVEKPEWKAQTDREHLALLWLPPNRVDQFLFSGDDIRLQAVLEHTRLLLVPRLPVIDLSEFRTPVAKPVESESVEKKKSVAARGKY
jgi:hypothetical protein